jgi:PAS domain-containing protein
MSSDIPTDVSESHVLAQALLNAPDDYVVILDRNGTILYANEAVKRRSPSHI